MAAKKGKGKARGKGGSSSKASVIKLSNKRLNKLAKQGKLKDRVKKSQYLKLLKQRTRGNIDPELAEQQDREEREEVRDIPLSEADYEYFATSGRDFSFITDVSDSEEKSAKRRSKKNKDQPLNDSLETKYEASSKKKGPITEKKHLLPIKTGGRLIQQSIEVTHQEEEEEEEIENGETEEISKPKPLPTLSPKELLIQRQKKLAKLKNEIGVLASTVVENPEENTKKLRELRGMLSCEDPDVFLTVKKLAMVSLTEVFKDIIPGYRIRMATDREKQQAATKETKRTRDFEESLLNNYRNFLEFLEVLIKGKVTTVHKKRRKKVTSALVPYDAFKPMRKLGLQSLCELLYTHTHFNYRTNIIADIVPFMNHKDEEVRTLVCTYVKKIFQGDKSGDVTLEIVRLIGRVIKAQKFDVQSCMLATLLVLKIKEVDRTPQDNKKTRKEKMAKLSRRDRKRKKQMEHLEKELEDAAASEKADNRLKLNTEIINMIFLTYFRILKMGADSHLLAVVLEGLAKFAHLINIDFMDDLFAVLNQLVDSGDLTYRESLHCVQTAIKILSGQGSTLNIDPMLFYRHLYTTLLDLHAGVSSDDLPIALESIDLMINKRKRQVSLKRLLAFTKRLITIALQSASNGSIAALAMARLLVHADSKVDLLYDTDMLGNGLFTPECEEPEHCNAANTSLYELHLLKRFYHPTVRQYASHLLAKAPTTGAGHLPMELSNKSPIDLHGEYDPSTMTFNPPIPAKPRNKKPQPTNGFLQHDITKLEEHVLQSVSLEKIVSFSPSDKVVETPSKLVVEEQESERNNKKRKSKVQQHNGKKKSKTSS